MSKLAHSSDEHMEQIEREAEGRPDEPHPVILHNAQVLADELNRMGGRPLTGGYYTAAELLDCVGG